MSFKNEKIVEEKKCRKCSSLFTITDKDLEFYEKISPVFNWEKYSVPSPTMCPKCRQQDRLIHQNMSKLYWRTCDLTWERILSCFHPESGYTVYKQESWWSGDFDASEYGRDYDLSRWFFEQFDELLKKVPVPSMFTNFTEDVNSDYTNYAGFDKNCYFIFHADMNEDCCFAIWLKKCKKCFDSLNVFECENTYECINVKKSYGLKYSQDCQNCSESWFLRDCFGCKDCFGCIGLQNAQYQIFNEQKTKEEYETFMENFSSDHKSITTMKKKYEDFISDKPRKFAQMLQNENAVWDHIFECRDVVSCFDIQESRDMKYCERIYNGPNADCMDIDQYGLKINRAYLGSAVWDGVEQMIACTCSYGIVNTYYSMFTFYSENCFGCVGLKNAKYCILNKQYTKEKYEELVPKIIEKMKQDSEWWEFFPSSMSPFGYNETVANEYFPLKKQQAQEKWFAWSDYETPFPKVEKIIPAAKLPSSISDIPDDILAWAIECEATKKPFRITRQELDFYRNHGLPIPRRHPEQRHLDRMNMRNPRKLYERNCDKCDKDIQSTYDSSGNETVYCEECYNKAIY